MCPPHCPNFRMVLCSFNEANRVRGILDQSTLEMGNLIPILEDQVHSHVKMLRIVEMKRRVQFLKNGKYHAEMLSRRFTIIWQENACPADLVESMTCLIYAAGRYHELSILKRFKKAMIKKYGLCSQMMQMMCVRPSALKQEVIDSLTVPNLSEQEMHRLLVDIAHRYKVPHIWIPSDCSCPSH